MDRSAVVAYLRGLPVQEMRAILKETEDAWSARIILHEPCQGCQQVVFGPHACPGPPEGSETLTVVLVDAGPNRIQVMTVIREITGFELRETRDLVFCEGPKDLVALGRGLAVQMRDKLVEVGAVVELRLASPKFKKNPMKVEPNGWVDPYPHRDLEGPCTGPCCFPEAYPKPITFTCDGEGCHVQLARAGLCVSCADARCTSGR